jgi:hypothetical protein
MGLKRTHLSNTAGGTMNSRTYFLLTLFLLVVLPAIFVCAEENTGIIPQAINPPTLPKIVDPSIFSETEFPVLFSDSKIHGYEKFSGSISVENKGAKITYAPFLFSTKYNFLSETRFQLSQKDKTTTIGVMFKSNPTSPRTKRGDGIWGNLNNSLAPYPLDKIYKLEHFEKESKRCLAKIKNDILGLESRLTEIREKLANGNINIDEKEGIKKEKKEVEKKLLLMTVFYNDKYINDQGYINERKNELEKLIKNYDKSIDNLYLNFRKKLLKYRMPILAFSYNLSLFPILASSDQDNDNNGLNDNEYSISKHSLAVTMDWGLSPKMRIAALLGYFLERPGAEEGTDFAKSIGFGLTVGTVLKELNKEGYRNTEDYKKSLFKPMLVLGISLEGLICTSNDNLCKDGIEKKFVLTPFMDFKIKKDTQFRIGLSFTRIEKIDGSVENDLGITSFLTLVLGEPK